MAKEEKKDKKEIVTKEEFDNLAKSVEGLGGILSDIVNKLNQPKDVAPTQGQQVEPTPDSAPVPPGWRKIVDETLGPDFGINVVYPETGAGFQFKIIVPKEKSNAEQAYLELYKVDVRTKAISYSEGIEGVRKYCELVAKNLGIKKQNA